MDSSLINSVVEIAIEKAMRQDMRWGVDDCSLWPCNIIKELTGVDLAEPFRGYNSRFGAAKQLKIYAGGGLIEASIKVAKRNYLSQACRPFRGNLVGIVMSPHRPSLALFWCGRWVARSQQGVTYLPAMSGVIAWSWM